MVTLDFNLIDHDSGLLRYLDNWVIFRTGMLLTILHSKMLNVSSLYTCQNVTTGV